MKVVLKNIAIYIFFFLSIQFIKFQYNSHLGGNVSTMVGYDHSVKLSGGLLLLVKLSNTLSPLGGYTMADQNFLRHLFIVFSSFPGYNLSSQITMSWA